ncbi:unnamed protein product, partial [Effrenium voratum]
MSSAEVILTKLGLLAGDDELDILPHFHNVFPVLLDLIAAAGRTGEQDADLLEHARECLVHLLKYRAKYLIDDMPNYLAQYVKLLKHKKVGIRHFSAESLALVFRRIPGSGMKPAMADAFQLLVQTPSSELQLLADGLGVLFFKTVRGVQRQFRAKTKAVLRCLLRIPRRASFEQPNGDVDLAPARAAQLRAVKMALLRMRNHARSLDDAGDVVEAIFFHFRQAVQRYTRAARGSSSVPEPEEEDEDSDSEEPPSKESAAQEVLFFVDLVVSWLFMKPRPSNCRGDSWAAFAAVAVECFSGILEAGNLETSSEPRATSFPPVAMPVSETTKRGFLLLWRAMPSAVAPLAEEKLAELFGGPKEVEAQAALLASGQEETLSLCAAAAPLPSVGLGRLGPRLAAAASAALGLGPAETRLRSERCTVGAQLHRWEASPGLLEKLLETLEALGSPHADADADAGLAGLAGAMASAGAVLRLFQAQPEQRAAFERLARLLPMAAKAASHAAPKAMLLARVFECCALAAQGLAAAPAPPVDSWPAAVPAGNPADWAAWTVAWGQSEAHPGPLFTAVSRALSAESAALVPLMPRVLVAAQSSNAQVRLAALRVARLLPAEALCRQLLAPDGAVGDASGGEPGEPGEPLKLLDLCQQLEDTPADFPNERKRSEQIRRLGKALQGRSWAAHLAMQIL